jgi:xanthine dehydrogenase accessory factor
MEPYLVELGERLRRMPFAGGGRGPGTAREPAPAPGDFFIEPREGARLPLLMFGAGHVGKAIATRTDGLPLHLAWFDSRPEAAETPGVVLAAEEEMVAAARAAGPKDAVVILTHDHGLDYKITAAALAGRARFVGLIGSQTKRARFISRLEKEGIPHDRLTCPIGVPGIAGKEPEVIAVALLAQLLMLERPE